MSHQGFRAFEKHIFCLTDIKQTHSIKSDSWLFIAVLLLLYMYQSLLPPLPIGDIYPIEGPLFLLCH